LESLIFNYKTKTLLLLIKEIGYKTLFKIGLLSTLLSVLEIIGFGFLVSILTLENFEFINKNISNEEILFFLLLITIAREIIKYIISIKKEATRIDLNHKLSEEIHSNILFSTFNSTKKIGRGELYSILNEEVSRSAQSIDQLIRFFESLISFLIYVFSIIFLSEKNIYPITLALLATLITSFLNRSSSWSLGNTYSDLVTSFQKIVNNSIDGYKTIRASSSENWFISIFKKNNKKFKKVLLNIFTKYKLLNSLRDISLILILLIWIYFYRSDIPTNILLTSLLFSYKSALSATNIIHAQRLIFLNLPSYNKILDIRNKLKNDIDKQVFDLEKYKNIESISWENSYCKIKKLHLNKGSITLIKGFSGIGKTTILDSFSGFSKENIWKLKLKNSTKIFCIKNQSIINKLITYCPQETKLFEISLLDNIKLGINISDEKIFNLMEMLNINYLLNDREYDKQISLTINKFSGGEVQRIGLIRSFLRENEIEVYDEPTTYLDDQSAALVIEMIKKRSKDKIILIASHDPRFMKISDNIIHLN